MNARTARPLVAVVIVAYRSGPLLERALRSVAGVEHVAEIVVCDHGDGADAAAAAAAGAVTLVDRTNPGFSAGVNRAVRATRSPYVLILNPDCELAPGALAAGVAVLDADAAVAVVSGTIVGAGGAVERSAGRLPGWERLLARALGLRRLLAFGPARRLAARTRVGRDHLDRRPDAARDVDFVAGTAPLVRRRAFDAVGGFDETFFLYAEDVDFSRRLRRAGWRLVQVPQRWAVHAGSASSPDPWRRELTAWQGMLHDAAQSAGAGGFALSMVAAVLRAATLAALRPAAAPGVVRVLVAAPIAQRRRVRRTRRAGR